MAPYRLHLPEVVDELSLKLAAIKQVLSHFSFFSKCGPPQLLFVAIWMVVISDAPLCALKKKMDRRRSSEEKNNNYSKKEEDRYRRAFLKNSGRHPLLPLLLGFGCCALSVNIVFQRQLREVFDRGPEGGPQPTTRPRPTSSPPTTTPGTSSDP